MKKENLLEAIKKGYTIERLDKNREKLRITNNATGVGRVITDREYILAAIDDMAVKGRDIYRAYYPDKTEDEITEIIMGCTFKTKNRVEAELKKLHCVKYYRYVDADNVDKIIEENDNYYISINWYGEGESADIHCFKKEPSKTEEAKARRLTRFLLDVELGYKDEYVFAKHAHDLCDKNIVVESENQKVHWSDLSDDIDRCMYIYDTCNEFCG